MVWFPTTDDPEWADITPQILTKDDQKYVYVQASQEYDAVMSYFRSLVAKKEYSERGYKLVKRACQLIPSNYTVWNYRRQVVNALGLSWKDELDYVRSIAEEKAKTYQVWHHRKQCIAHLKDPLDEIPLLEEFIRDDHKNYHAWGYRQWLLSEFPIQISINLSKNIILDDDNDIKQRDIYIDNINTILDEHTTHNNIDITHSKILHLYNQFNNNNANDNMNIIFNSIVSHYTYKQLQLFPLCILPLWSHEYQFTCDLLRNDPRNNSAWNQQMYILTTGYNIIFNHHYQSSSPHTGTTTTTTVTASTPLSLPYLNKIRHHVIYQQLYLCITTLSLISLNESCWNVLVSLSRTSYISSSPHILLLICAFISSVIIHNPKALQQFIPINNIDHHGNIISDDNDNNNNTNTTSNNTDENNNNGDDNKPTAYYFTEDKPRKEALNRCALAALYDISLLPLSPSNIDHIILHYNPELTEKTQLLIKQIPSQCDHNNNIDIESILDTLPLPLDSIESLYHYIEQSSSSVTPVDLSQEVNIQKQYKHNVSVNQLHISIYICKLLMSSDFIRRKYWAQQANQLQKMIINCTTSSNIESNQ